MGGAETGVGPFESMSFKGPHRPVRRHRPTVRPVWSRQPRQRLTKRVAPPAGPSVPFWPRSPLRECVGQFYAREALPCKGLWPLRDEVFGAPACRPQIGAWRPQAGLGSAQDVARPVDEAPTCGRARRVRIRFCACPTPLTSARPSPARCRTSAPTTATPSSTTTSGCVTRSHRRRWPTSRRRTPGPRPGPRTWPACGRPSSARSRHAPRRPTCRCPHGSAATGTTGARSRGSSTASPAAAPPPARTTGPRRSSPPTWTCPARRCCSTSTSSPRVTPSSPSGWPRSAPMAGCWRSAPTPSATSASCSRSRT